MKYNYESVVNTIQNTRRFGTLTGYEVSKRMLEQLGNPQKEIPFVHIAGTNGKGSTTAFLCEILKQAGFKVGMFTSPHLVTFEERIRINGQYILKEDVERLGTQLLEMEFDVSPTMFDYCLCMAVLYFKEQNCDLMVMETGIGGRFDSTNALGIPLVSVITKIGFDHMAILGNSLEEIAYEKAGIIKKGVPVVLQKQEETARKVICDYVFEINCENEIKEKRNNILNNRNNATINSLAVVENNKDAKHNNNIKRHENINENTDKNNGIQRREDTSKNNSIQTLKNTNEKNNTKVAEGIEQSFSSNSENEKDRCKYLYNYLIEGSQSIREYVSKLPKKMLGNFQIENATTALLTAVCIFQSSRFNNNINRNIFENSFEKTRQMIEGNTNSEELSTIQLVNKKRDNIEILNIENTIKCKNKILKTEPNLPSILQSLPEVYLKAIEQGISQAVWKGRMELINENPFFLIDGAHNPDGVHALAESLRTLYPNEKFHFIMAVMADKDYETMIEELIPLAIDFVTVTPEYNRALQAKELAECIAKKGVKASFTEKLEDVIVPLLPVKDTVKVKDIIKEEKTKVINWKVQNRNEKINNEKMNNEKTNDCKIVQETENDKNDNRNDKTDNRNNKTVAFGSLYFIGEVEALL